MPETEKVERNWKKQIILEVMVRAWSQWWEEKEEKECTEGKI